MLHANSLVSVTEWSGLPISQGVNAMSVRFQSFQRVAVSTLGALVLTALMVGTAVSTTPFA